MACFWKGVFEIRELKQLSSRALLHLMSLKGRKRKSCYRESSPNIACHRTRTIPRVQHVVGKVGALLKYELNISFFFIFLNLYKKIGTNYAKACLRRAELIRQQVLTAFFFGVVVHVPATEYLPEALLEQREQIHFILSPVNASTLCDEIMNVAIEIP